MVFFTKYYLRIIIPCIAMMVITFLYYTQISLFFKTNLIVNSVILMSLILGILYCLKSIILLHKEYRWFVHYKHILLKNSHRDSSIEPIESVLSIPKLRFLSLTYRMVGQISHEQFNHNQPLRISYDQSRLMSEALDDRLGETKEIANYMVGLLVFLGLLGTFWGLLVTIGGVGDVVANVGVGAQDQAAAVANLKEGLEVPLSGMGSAFSSSLFGLGGSLVMGYIALQLGIAQGEFYTHIEEWLSSFVGNDKTSHQTSNGDGLHYLIEANIARLSDAIETMNNQTKQQQSNNKKNHDAIIELKTQLKNLENAVTQLANNHHGNDTQILARQLQSFAEEMTNHAAQDTASLREEIKTTNRLLARIMSANENN